MSEKLLKRVAALFALSDNNPSPEEAQSALEQARALLQKHNLTMIDVESVEDHKGAQGGYSETATVGEKIAQWKKSVAAVVAEYLDIKVVTRKYVRKRDVSFLFYGLVLNTEIAIGIFLSLLRQIETMTKNYHGKGHYAKSVYRQGILYGLDQRLEILKIRQNSKCTALAICSNKVADNWMENEGIKVERARVKTKKEKTKEQQRKDRNLFGWDRQLHFSRGLSDSYSLVLEKVLDGKTKEES